MVPRFRTAALAAVTFSIGHLLWVLSRAGGPYGNHAVSRACVAAVTLATAVWCGHSAWRAEGHARRGWALFSAASLCWLLANGLAAVQERGGGPLLDVPSPPGAPAVAALVLCVVAVLAFLRPALSSSASLRILVDELLIAVSLLMVTWPSLILESRSEATGTAAFGVIRTVLEIGLVSLVLVTVTRVRPESRVPWMFLLAGAALVAGSHGVGVHLRSGADLPAGLDAALWLPGWAFVGLAALVPRRVLVPLTARRAPPTLLRVVGPCLPAVLALGLALGGQLGAEHHRFLVVSGAVIAVLLLARQFVAQLENVELARNLDARVEERTAELQRQERHFRSLVSNTSEILTVVDAGGRIQYQSPSVRRALGFGPKELLGTPIAELFHPGDRSVAMESLRSVAPRPEDADPREVRLRRRNGGWCLVEMTVGNLLGDDSVRGFLLTCRDVSRRKRLEDGLRHAALHDPLTGLANRTLFRDRLEHAMARSARGAESLALVMVDLDDFKLVNDTLGHAVGDAVLKEASRRLFQSVRAGDTVARMGGDEFAVLLERSDEDALAHVAQRILEWPRTPIDIDGHAVAIQASVGVATGLTSSVGADELLRNADLAMYVAKSKGKGGYEVFTAGMHAESVERERRQVALHRALEQGEFVLHYQPVVELAGGCITGAEALVRWNHPDLGLLPPGEFLPLAEQSELVLLIGRWALTEACRQARQWLEQFPLADPLTVSVNVAATRQLTSPGLATEVREALERSGLPPRQLMLEVTGGALMGDVRAIVPVLRELKQLGVKLAIDDFGEGWSSLSRMRACPMDKLKIDRSFVEELGSSDEQGSIVTAVVAMAQSLRASTVAEGVETREQLACLRARGCHEAQGFLLSPPLPASDFEALLEDAGGLLEAPELGAGQPPAVPSTAV